MTSRRLSIFGSGRARATASIALSVALAGSVLTGYAGPASSRAETAAASAEGPFVQPWTCGTETQRRAFRVGISPGYFIYQQSDATRADDLAVAANLGAKQIRIDINWDQIQPTATGGFDWAQTDKVINAVKNVPNETLYVLGVIGYAPAWAKAADGTVDAAKFGAFVSAAAAHLGPRVTAWEIWNEPNLGRERDGVRAITPTNYARLVEAAAPGIRTNDPGAQIAMGALAPAEEVGSVYAIGPVSFLRDVYTTARINLGSFDVVSTHPYTHPDRPSDTDEYNSFNKISRLRTVMTNAGDQNTKMWLTEYGAPTGTAPNAVTEAKQSSLIREAYCLALQRPYVERLFVYSMRDSGSTLSESEQNFGLRKPGGVRKAAFADLKAMIAANTP